ncbi:MAG TPA: homoserine kinase [Actinomycetota bacterium]|jgi:homoserine kinase
MRLVARVPATSANLGPGFDCFGLALDLCNEVAIDTDAEPGVSWEGEGAGELPTDGSDRVSRAIARVAEAAGIRVPRFALRGRNRIPLASGLGSSAAAAVAGVALGGALVGESRADPVATFAVAAELEGHPDNAAPAVFGGFTIVAGDLVERLDPHPGLRPVVLIPEGVRVSTEAARRALADPVAREDAVFNVAHAALTMARILRDPDRLGPAMRDRLHEDARLALVPEVRPVFDRLRGDDVPVCVSGSGPALLAFERDARPVPDPGSGWRVLRLAVRAEGVQVTTG